MLESLNWTLLLSLMQGNRVNISLFTVYRIWNMFFWKVAFVSHLVIFLSIAHCARIWGNAYQAHKMTFGGWDTGHKYRYNASIVMPSEYELFLTIRHSLPSPGPMHARGHAWAWFTWVTNHSKPMKMITTKI